MSISTQREREERERPSEQIKFPIFKQPRQPKDTSEETSSVQTSGAGAWNQKEMKCIKQWPRQSLFEKGKKGRAGRRWTKPVTVMLTRTPQQLQLLEVLPAGQRVHPTRSARSANRTSPTTPWGWARRRHQLLSGLWITVFYRSQVRSHQLLP